MKVRNIVELITNLCVRIVALKFKEVKLKITSEKNNQDF